jgi:hypothetical protein
VEIRKIPIEQLNPAAYNPRKDLQPGDPEYEKLKRSMQEFGYVEPIVWNKRTGNIVGGHQRYKVLLDMGMSEVDCVVVDLDETKEKALNVALNKISGDWDMPKLKDILQELDTGAFDIELTGFDMDEIEDLMTQFHVPGEIIEDEVPEPPDEPIAKPGDLWILGRHRLLCGDATSPDDVARLMNGKKADMVFTDPPYDLDISYAANLFNNYKGHCFVLNTINRIVDLIILNRKEFSRLFVVDFRIPHLVSNSAPMDRVDFIAEFKNSKSKFVNLKDGFSTLIECAKVHSNKAKGNFGHAQAKRVELPAQFIEHYSRKGEIVLDLFGGSGSTLIACEQLNRTCYMMEIDPVYCDVIVQRWENLTGQKAEMISG